MLGLDIRGARLPPWYVEGYAEFMSGMTFSEENTEFIIGDYPGRAKVPGSQNFDTV